ncbi:RagB/SusD family nutrient uptake outer membrane protein [Desertivirga xinjiangensis]|uniref:RagB/SusD family nutrient uptake outer membrane protein n=1 Tax=Desertivirga xinjiangensis TaxID=539206 RepID=UPI00210C945D|nr:RagB/SusD family nutrient uptake outer membrane protein [Pedobacter xinjiangensis]
MKKYCYSLTILTFAAALFTACQEMEDRPLEKVTDSYLWDPNDPTGTNASFFLNSIYADLPTGYNRIGSNLLCAASDDAVPSADNTAIALFTNGGYNANANDDNSWASNYESIRKCNLFVQNIDRINLRSDIAQQGIYWRAENRFLRAMFYYELIKRYGGVPLLGDRVLTINDDLKLPRNSYDECVNYIVSECDAITPDLRPDPLGTANAGEYGRITKMAALTLKAKTLLYAASPLNNPSNDQSKWIKAKNALAEAIRYGEQGGFALEPSFTNVFLARQNKEIILAYQRQVTFDVETNNAPVGYVGGNTTSNGRTSPTQELVDAFTTIKGLPISVDVKSGSNLTGYDSNLPYANRDPRLSYTVFYNGAQWLGRGVETFTGGLDRPGGSRTQTKTGYYMSKFMGNFAGTTSYANQTHNFPIFRYADVMLMFAEAKNEVDGPGSGTDSVYNFIRAIRARAGIALGSAPNTYGVADGLNTAQMRELIRNERRVEMAFEEQRFWDIRRWKIAETVYNRPLHGMRITRSGNNLTYQVEELGTPFRFIAPRMYRYAIPFSEISKNPNLTQNQGYQ